MAEDEAVVEMTKEAEEDKVSAAIASVTANRPGVTISIATPVHLGTTVKPASTSSITLTKAATESRPDDDDGEDEDDDENGSPGVVEIDDDDDEEDDEDDQEEDDDDQDDDDDDEDEDDDDEEDDSEEEEEEDEAEDPLAIEEDDSVLEGSVTESSLIEAPGDDSSTPAKVTKLVQPIIPAIFKKQPSVSITATESPSGSSTPTGDGRNKRRGRPTRAEMDKKEKERQERLARGETAEPTPKRRGRKPKTAEEKLQSRLEKKKSKQREKQDKRKEKQMEKQRLKEERQRKKREREDKKKEKADKRQRPETEEEREAKAQARKAKYEEFKRAKVEKAEKRKQRNEELRIYRQKKKDEEKKQREAYEKRMQELKASFLDESSHLSGTSQQIGIAGDVTAGGILDETSQSSVTSMNRSRVYGACGSIEMSQLKPIRSVTAETLMEYRWPLESRHSEHYFLQEQVSEYLGVKSFKRRYPDIQRRNVDHKERDFLVEIGVVTVVQADLGLTAIPSSTVLDIMSNDFYEKYDEYMSVVAERKDRNLRQYSHNYYNSNSAVTVPVEKHKLQDFVEKAVKSAATWNKSMNTERREKRKAYFDLQTFNIHMPMNDRGVMKVVKRPKIGHYPVALIPGQFTDHYHSYSAQELSYLPLNTALKAPPVMKAGMRGFADLNLKAEKDPDNCSLCSCSSCDSDDGSGSSNSGSSGEEEEATKNDVTKGKNGVMKSENGAAKPAEIKPEEAKPKRPINAEIPGAKCKNCNGDRQHNKLGIPELLLHCSNCDSSCHPTCLGLCLELLQYVTNYNWECTECKVCSKCKDHADEDKMLFCDLCDRGYHSYCVGLDEIPSGRWHCTECSYCMSCQSRDASGNVPADNEGLQSSSPNWVFEYKIGNNGSKIYSHTLCVPCHKAWKKNQFCPECSVCFGREHVRRAMDKNMDWKGVVGALQYAGCWVCGRQHHSHCVAHPDQFICAACQKRTLEKSIGSVLRFTSASTVSSTPTTEPASFSHSFVAPPPSSFLPSTSSGPSYATTSMMSSPPATALTTPSRKSGVPDSSGPMTCEFCQKVYKNKSTLYSHKNRDHGVRGSATSLTGKN